MLLLPAVHAPPRRGDRAAIADDVAALAGRVEAARASAAMN